MSNYNPRLKHQIIIDRIETLSFRIHDRFPKSSLKEHSFLFLQFAKVFRDNIAQAKNLSKWFWLWKAMLIVVSISLSIYLLIILRTELSLPSAETSSLNILDACFNMSFLFFGFLYFLSTLDKWYTRKRISVLLIELKNFIHVADMHQINKDPNHFHDDYIKSENSPTKKLTQFELQRYLDYTSEFVSLASKLSCLVLNKFNDDQEIMSRVNEVVLLCNGITHKIWQKIIILNTLEDSR